MNAVKERIIDKLEYLETLSELVLQEVLDFVDSPNKSREFKKPWARSDKMNAHLVTNINLPMPQIYEFCQRWQIIEFALFGSVLRDDFGSNSDIDCLVKFSDKSDWSLFDRVQMQQELALIMNRKVDLINKRAIERSHNWIRKKEILNTAQTIYVNK